MIHHSRIFRGTVAHRRLLPTEHAFVYPMTFFAFDLNELAALTDSVPLFGYNRRRVLRLQDRDYLHGDERPIREQLEDFLPTQTAGQRTLLITSPRYLGYAFNPVNFHLRMHGARLFGAVAEVNNTFGDRHVYPLTELLRETANPTWTARCPKEFHVSPFNDRTGEYAFTFQIEPNRLALSIDLHREGACVMRTSMQGKGAPITNGNILRHVFLHPFDTALNSMPRILWQAALLHYRKRLPVFRRPSPESPRTLIDRDKPTDGPPKRTDRKPLELGLTSPDAP